MAGDELMRDARTVIVVADPATADVAESWVAASGLNVVQVSLADAAAIIRDHARSAAAFVDLRFVDADAAGGLGAVFEAAEDASLPLVVAFGVALLDEVGGLLLGSDTILLCDPAPSELAAALAVAVNDPELIVRDGSLEAMRLQRLNEEVARFAATLAKLSTQEGVSGGRGGDPFVADRSMGFDAQPTAMVDPVDIRRAIRARRLRDDAFDLAGLFEDPAWDMLLDLFAAELERRRVSVSSLCIAAAVAPTTALRWIGKLIDAGLLDRRADEFDRRRAYLSLTARASTAMRNYLAALHRAGLSIA